MNTDEILHLATLARLELSDKEIAAFPGQFEEILTFVSQIKDIDLGEGIVRDMQNYNTLRDDVAREADDSRAGIIEAFPRAAGDLLEVSKMLPN